MSCNATQPHGWTDCLEANVSEPSEAHELGYREAVNDFEVGLMIACIALAFVAALLWLRAESFIWAGALGLGSLISLSVGAPFGLALAWLALRLGRVATRLRPSLRG